MSTIKTQLEDIVKLIPVINDERQYWLIRTESGLYFDTFVANGFVAIGYDDIPYSEIAGFKKDSAGDDNNFITRLKKRVHIAFPEEKKPGLIAGQISKFIYGIKKDDIVLIPSENSESIAFGIVEETPIFLATDDQIVKTGCEYSFRKKIKWIKRFRRADLDPYLYKALFAHQAINNLKDYSEEIERSIQDFFAKGEDAHIVLDVDTQNDIHAYDLFELGHSYLRLLREMSENFNLDINVREIEVKITLNSPGKLHFKAPDWKTIVAFGCIILAVNGGGLKVKGIGLDLSTDGFMKNLTDYLNNKHDREIQDKVLTEYTDSLQVKMPKDLVNILKQAASNKSDTNSESSN